MCMQISNIMSDEKCWQGVCIPEVEEHTAFGIKFFEHWLSQLAKEKLLYSLVVWEPVLWVFCF